MFANMHERLANIAEEDSDREDRIGAPCPIRLDLWLTGGRELTDVALVDGVNSLDDQTIDVRRRSAPPACDETFTVAILHIAAVRHVWPSEKDEAEALRKKKATDA